MYDAPASRRPLPFVGPVGEQRGPWMAEVKPGDLSNQSKPLRAAALKALADRCENLRADAIANGAALPPSTAQGRRPSNASVISAASSSMMPVPRVHLERRRKPVAAAPWDSLAVQQFSSMMYNSSVFEAGLAPSAMILQAPGGHTILQAIGEAEDHKVASRTVADIQTHLHKDGNSRLAPQGLGGTTESQLKVVRSGQPAPLQQSRVSFGAVYEHRDASGKAKIVGSTAVVPEHQFQLDWQEHGVVKELSKHSHAPGSSGHLVWVGVGAGPVGEQEMARVRQAVVDARSERLKIEKLSSEKPFSRHF